MNKARLQHVGLNAHLLSLDENYRGAGINWYIYHMLHHLPDADPELRYTAFLYEPRFSPRQGMRVVRSSWATTTPARRIVWEQLVAPWMLSRERVDLMHAMAFVAPFFSPCPTVVTVMDLSFMLFPDAFTPSKRTYLRWMTRLSVRRASQVIAISASTRQDVIACLQVPEQRVQVIYCGVEDRFRPLPAAVVEAFRRQKGLPERFILFLGTIEPRKNIPHLIAAFARLCAAAPQEMAGIHLVLAGGKGWLAEEVFARGADLGMADRIHFVGYVPEDEKPLWYNAALCFCYPSLYEGFGLPPLEAMACGTPVIVSDASSLPEVVGNAGLIVPSHDTDALGEALHSLIGDANCRADLSRRGQERARLFSWARAAQETVDLYRRAWGEE